MLRRIQAHWREGEILYHAMGLKQLYIHMYIHTHTHTHNYTPISTHSLFFTLIHLACVALVLHCIVLCTLTVRRTRGVRSLVCLLRRGQSASSDSDRSELVLFETCRDTIQPLILSLITGLWTLVWLSQTLWFSFFFFFLLTGNDWC